jgi:hypothetical protein
MKIKPRFIFDNTAELVNGRLAMIGFISLLFLELVTLSGPFGNLIKLIIVH